MINNSIEYLSNTLILIIVGDVGLLGILFCMSLVTQTYLAGTAMHQITLVAYEAFVPVFLLSVAGAFLIRVYHMWHKGKSDRLLLQVPADGSKYYLKLPVNQGMVLLEMGKDSIDGVEIDRRLSQNDHINWLHSTWMGNAHANFPAPSMRPAEELFNLIGVNVHENDKPGY